MAHVYDWARARGYWVRHDDVATTATHLLLDGGKLAVPDESASALLNAYAASLARWPTRRPCIVERRTPVFRFFLDLDTRFESAAAAAAARRGDAPVRAVLAALCGAVSGACGGPREALVCAASAAKAEGDGTHKLGFHLVWPDVLVRRRTALALRDACLRALDARLAAAAGVANAWDTVLDAAVFNANGLRMPWSAKGRGDARFYELRLRYDVGDFVDAAVTTVSGMREALRRLSIRTSGLEPTLALVGDEAEDAADAEGGQWVPGPLSAHADVLRLVDDALPVQFAAQRFTALVRSEHCVMLRSTSRFCFNLGREHRTNNVYFQLTRRGVCQRCYCRCETAEGRRYGMCKDFASDVWAVDPAVTRAFFGDEPEPESPTPSHAPANAPSHVSAMPSRAGKSFLAFDNLAARSRPALTPPRRPKRPKTSA